MRVMTYNLEGTPIAEAELAKGADAQLLLDGASVLAVSLWGSKVALTLPRRLVLIAVCDYGQLTRYGGLETLSCAQRPDGTLICAGDRRCGQCLQRALGE
jgi:hypothetical protein